MEQHEETHRSQRAGIEPDWSHVLGRVFDDFSRLLQIEARLFEANLGRVLMGLVDRALGQLFLFGAFAAASFCLLGALILGLHNFMPWWEAFAIAGGTALLLGLLGYLFLIRAATHEESQLPSS